MFDSNYNPNNQNNSQEPEEKLTPQEKLRMQVREDFYNGKILPFGFCLPCPLGHRKTMFEYGDTWRCATCRSTFHTTESQYYKSIDVGVSNLHKQELSVDVPNFPDVKIVVEFVKVFTENDQINRVINIRIRNGVSYGANESAELALSQLHEILPNASFKNGFSRNMDIIMEVDNGNKD
jgi:hypothetical protein